ncbi:MAG: 50S ribosomal protein L24 [Desulfobacterales bacterium C00003060]|nr:MAG: 50S ribosomal protein L24 [Desulfobacterales bacterium S3730MH5]OEU79243.1 MAG: 50S ribosomal protein L24 [Desulfobacterales bacterium C00003060]OEU81096.1 MAG: 50S ribosomal protein L24 [Desulfobacterales bacterium S5133MH4]
MKCRIKKDDKVKVIAGKEKGKMGKVLRVFRDSDRAVIENVNIVKCHTKARGQRQQAGIIEKEAPIHRSNLMLMCNKCINPVRIKMQSLEDGRRVRMCRKCGEIMDT